MHLHHVRHLRENTCRFWTFLWIFVFNETWVSTRTLTGLTGKAKLRKKAKDPLSFPAKYVFALCRTVSQSKSP